jgi:hypothetical protein
MEARLATPCIERREKKLDERVAAKFVTNMQRREDSKTKREGARKAFVKNVKNELRYAAITPSTVHLNKRMSDNWALRQGAVPREGA